MPEFFLSFSYNHVGGGYVLVSDMQRFDKKKLRTERDWKRHISGIYYMLQSMNADFHSCRQGISLLAECDGFSFSNMSYKQGMALCTDMFAVYPYNIQHLKYFHSTLFINMTISLCRPLLPRSIHSKFETGCIFAGGRLDAFYVLPDRDQTTNRTIVRMLETARRRYAMTGAFRL